METLSLKWVVGRAALAAMLTGVALAAAGWLTVGSAVVICFTALAVFVAQHELLARRRLADVRRAEAERFARQRSALNRLVRDTIVTTDDLHANLRRICEVTAQTLRVERVSIWRYAPDRLAIGCVNLYHLGTARHSEGVSLKAVTYPAYFEALGTSEVIAADEARRDPRTSDFSREYLEPLGITSMLDVPLYLFGTLEGVICHEHVGAPRRWTQDEQSFAIAISNLISLAYEQSERKRAADETVRTEALLNTIVDNIPAILFVKEAATLRYVRLNQAAYDLMGYARGELEGKYDHDFLPKSEADGVTATDREVLRGGHLLDIPEEPIQTRHQGRRWLRTIKVPIPGEDGRPLYLLGISEDITDQKHAEGVRATLQYAIDHGLEGVALLDAEGRYTYVNPAYAAMYGFMPSEVIGASWKQLYGREQAEVIERTCLAILAEQGQWQGELIGMKKSGEPFDVEVCLTRLPGAPGIAEVIVSTCRDITERKRSEAALQASRAFARNIVASSLDMIIVTDDHRHIVEFNPAAEESFGYRAEEILGKPMALLYADPQTSEQIVTATLKHGRHVQEVVHRKQDGSEFHSLLSASVLRDASGAIIGVMSVSRDVTEHKQAVEDLRRAKDSAEAANQAKSEFLASMSHEIRTPMNAIIGMADLLWETPLSPEQQEYVGIFRRASISLLNLLNDILDLSKVEAGYLELEHLEFDLRDVVDKTAEMMALRAQEKGLDLACSVAPDVPTDLIGDPNRLRQILLNLIGNAVKFTEYGEIVLRVVRDPEAETPGRIRFMISDTGVGISPDKVDHIFERFTQGDSSTTRRYGGTGLGLAISRRLVELMGGRIWVVSEVGHGSTFYFTAHFDLQTADGTTPPFVDMNLTGVKVLVADDNPTNRLILREALASWGAVVTETEGGAAALAELRCPTAIGGYRLVLLDSHMPDLSGFEVVQRATELGRLEGVTVMMLTSDSQSPDIARSYKLGLGGYLVKPIRRSDLQRAIAIAMNRPKGLGSASAYPREGVEGKPLKILLVEDSPDNTMLIRSYLKSARYLIDHAENGEVAVERFKRGEYDLVLMDLHMPVMDGYTATAIIRQWEQGQARQPIPVVALTAFGMRDEEARSLAAGCTAHLTKPIRKATLLAAITQYAGTLV